MSKILTSSTGMECPVALACSATGEGSLVCLDALTPKGRLVSPIYEARQFLHWKLYTVWHFSDLLILSLGDTRNELKVFLGLKCTVTPRELMTRRRPSETPFT